MGTALITGASSGLGEEFAWQLATARHNVVLVARSGDRLTELASRLESAAGVRAEVIVADLSVRSDLNPVIARLEQVEHPVGLLINNAGYALPNSFLSSAIAQEEAMLDVMVRSVMVLSQVAANAMRPRGRGAILNVSSVAAYTATGTYSAAKAWVKTFTEGLAGELRGTGVTATALLPGLTHTEFHERAKWSEYDTYPDIAWLSAADVVTQALRDLGRGVVLSTPSLRYATLGQIARIAPRAVVRRLS